MIAARRSDITGAMSVQAHSDSIVFDRSYGVSLGTKVATSWWIAGIFLLFGCGILVTGSLPWNVPEGIASLTAGALLVRAWGRNLDRRAGMVETPEGLRLGAIGSKPTLLRWESVARFDHSRVWPHWFVLAIAHDGAVRWIRNASQGARIAWDGGDTRDIAGVLNERLDTWRALNNVEPPVIPVTTSDGPIEKLGTAVRLQTLLTTGLILGSGVITIFSLRH